MPAAGSYQLKISGKPGEKGEIATSNNDQISFVDVREGGGKILYLDGTATMEQVFLRRARVGFLILELDYKWIPEDTQTSWPIDLEQDLKAEKYDALVLGDLPATALGEFQLKQLSSLLARVRVYSLLVAAIATLRAITKTLHSPMYSL